MNPSVKSVIEDLTNLDEILEENRALKLALETANERSALYRREIKDMQDVILNYEGALRRRQDETHMLYHKASTLLGDKVKPKDYDKLPDLKKRVVLQKILDTIEPKSVRFKGTDVVYSLQEFGVQPDANPVSDYTDHTALYFC